MGGISASVQSIDSFKDFLASKNLAKSICQDYEWEARKFVNFAKNKKITSELLRKYRAEELRKNSESAVQLSIAGVNKYMEFIGCPYRMERIDAARKKVRSDEEPPSVEEYLQILNAIKRTEDERLYLIVQSIGSAGLKLSELRQLTVDAAKKGKITLDEDRVVYLPKSLCDDLLEYCRQNNIFMGTILTTRCGNVPNRSNVSRAIKMACKGTDIDPEKLSTKAIRQFYFNSLESLRSEMVDIMDEERRSSRDFFFAKSGENSLDCYSEKYFAAAKDTLKLSVYDRFLHIYDEYISPVLGNLDCRRLTLSRIERLGDKINKLPIRTQANVMRVLRLILEFARENGGNIRVADRYFETVGGMRILADDELDRLTSLLRQSENPLDKGIYLCLNTGIGIDELCKLKCEDFDFSGGVLTVGGANDRKIYLPKFLTNEMESVYGNLSSETLIVSATTDGSVEAENRFLDICEQCGIENADFSVLRDTFGAMCAESRIEPAVMGEIMGVDVGECGRYFSENLKESRSPLEFLREAY